MYEAELEAFADLEDEFECEDMECEGEEFLGSAWRWLSRPASTQRRVALAAAKNALRAGGTAAGATLGGLTSFGAGAPVGGVLGGTLGSGLAALLPDKELMSEYEDEDEFEGGALGAAAEMEHLAMLASNADSEAEAEAFLGALIPLAAKALPMVAKVARRVSPGLIRGVSGIAKTLFRSPGARRLMRAVPTVVRRTAVDIARQAARGRPPSGRRAVQSLARNTARVLGNPQRCAIAMRRAQRLHRLHHGRQRALRAAR